MRLRRHVNGDVVVVGVVQVGFCGGRKSGENFGGCLVHQGC